MDRVQGNDNLWYMINNTIPLVQGIPYAEPPVGQRRFLPPIPPTSWVTPLYTADQNLTICPQLILGSLYDRSDEDCLHLTVHVPHQEEGEGNIPNKNRLRQRLVKLSSFLTRIDWVFFILKIFINIEGRVGDISSPALFCQNI